MANDSTPFGTQGNINLELTFATKNIFSNMFENICHVQVHFLHIYVESSNLCGDFKM